MKGEKEIRQYFEEKMPKRVKKARGAALSDLYEGPGGGGGMSFTKAVGILRDWWSEHGSDIYYDNDIGQVLGDREPSAYEDEDTGEIFEPDWSEIYQYSQRDVARIVFGSELAPHVR